MSKVTGPAHCLQLAGKLGGMIFSRYKGINRAFKQYKQTNPRTDKQLKIRSAYSIAQKYWQTNISDEWKKELEVMSRIRKLVGDRHMSGFNFYMMRALNSYFSTCFPDNYPATFEVTKPAEEFIFSWTCLL